MRTPPLVGEGGQVQFQVPIPHRQLAFGKVGPLEGHQFPEGVDLAEEFLIGAAAVHRPLEHGVGGGVAVDEAALVVKGHNAVGHVEEEGVQLVAFIFHGGQGGLQDTGHLVEGAGEDADLVGRLHRQFAVKVPGGYPLRAGGQLLNGANHGFGQQETQEHGDQQADDQGLHDD